MITSAGPVGLARALRRASRESRQSMWRVLARYLALRRAGRRLMLAEYLAYGLFWPKADPEQYVGVIEGAILSLGLNYRKNRRALVHDKLLFDAMLRGLGFPVPGLQAVVGKIALEGPLRTLEGVDGLARFLVQDARYPVFVKPAKGQNSVGALAIQAVDREAGEVILPCGTREPIAAVAASLRAGADGPLLIQDHLRQHPEIEAIVGGTVACLRVITFLEAGRPLVLRAFWKIPVGGAVADNLWRGNMIAGIDVDTGAISAVRAHAGIDAPSVDRHPDTGAVLTGLVLPDWPEIERLSGNAAMLLRGMPLVGWDIAMGAAGPVIVEANSVPSVELTQVAEPRGFLIGNLLARMEAELARLQAEEVQTASAKTARVRQIVGRKLLPGIGARALRQR